MSQRKSGIRQEMAMEETTRLDLTVVKQLRHQAQTESWMLRFVCHQPADNWQEWASCRGTDTELWFVKGSQSDLARAICTNCPARLPCGATAVAEEAHEPWVYGIRGGIGPSIRRDIARKLRQQ